MPMKKVSAPHTENWMRISAPGWKVLILPSPRWAWNFPNWNGCAAHSFIRRQWIFPHRSTNSFAKMAEPIPIWKFPSTKPPHPPFRNTTSSWRPNSNSAMFPSFLLHPGSSVSFRKGSIISAIWRNLKNSLQFMRRSRHFSASTNFPSIPAAINSARFPSSENSRKAESM